MLKSLTILCCSLLKWKHTASTTLAVIDVLDLVTQKYTDVLPCFIEAISPWFTHKDAEMKQLLYHHIASISSSLPFFHFCFPNVLVPSNKCITCSESTLYCRSWLLFYADPILGYDNRNAGLSCWTSCLLFSGPSWLPSSSQRRPLKGCLHIETVCT